MSTPDLEALVTPRVREAIRAAIERVGEKEFSSITGLTKEELGRALASENEYVGVTLVSLACKINQAHGDPVSRHSSVSECLKGAVLRLPQTGRVVAPDEKQDRPISSEVFKTRHAAGSMYDQKTVKILNFSANTITLLILGYFLGGIALAPLFGIQACVGLSFAPLAPRPCLGSVLGLVVGSFAGLAYTYYFFVKKL